MKYKRFDVVELKNGNKATILDINNREYYAEIVDKEGTRVDIRNITEDEIFKIIFQNNYITKMVLAFNG